MLNSSHETIVKNFNLFGESDDLPDVVHCESIAKRSVLHNWEFVPHRHARLHQVLLIEKGGGKAEIEGKTNLLSPSSLVNVPIGCVHAFSFFKETQGWVVTLSDVLLDELLKETEGIRAVLKQARIIETDSGVSDTFEKISHEHATLNFARAHILRALSGLLLGQVARCLFDSDPLSGNRPELQLKVRFETLVDEHYVDHWNVSEYAEKLAVTPGHLSRVMRQATGGPASRMIEARIVREARRRLAYTNLTVSEIAYSLGFIDPAYFSRVFTRAADVSPRKFRGNLAKRRRTGST